MIKTKILVLLGSGFIIAGASSLVAYFYEPLRFVLFLFALFTLMVSMIGAQLTYAFHVVRKSTDLKRRGYMACPHCGKAVLIEETTCPHCEKNI